MKSAPDEQIFLLTRPDFGTFLTSLLYIRCWQKKRGDTCLVILTFQFKLVKKLAKLICPETRIIFPLENLTSWFSRIFGPNHVYHKTLIATYAFLSIDFPAALFIYDQSSIKGPQRRSNYVPFLDKNLNSAKSLFSQNFLQAYVASRKIMDSREFIYYDFFDLYYQTDIGKCINPFSQESIKLRNSLKIDGKYVVLNTNLKHYVRNFDDKKRIQFPERYNVVIDHLIEKGFTVVIQGRKEQPLFKPRTGLVDYSRSKFATIENDLILYSGSTFAICSKSGPETFSAISDVPLLGLNYVELASMQPNHKMRFYPKHVVEKSSQRELSWHEMLRHPSFFDVGRISDQSVEYVDLEEHEMLNALDEFLELVHQPPTQWLSYAENQKKFLESLHPVHCDLYYIRGVPCEAYLKNTNG